MNAFLADLKKYEPLIAMAVNVGLLASGVGAPFEPLAVGIENSLNPLLQAAGNPQTVASTEAAVYSAIIGALTVLKAVPGLPQATLDEVNSYLIAAQAGVAAYFAAGGGFDAANYQPVAPIA